MKLFFSHETPYSWTCAEGFSFRGYFIAEDRCLRGEAAIAYLREQFASRPEEDVFFSLNGMFSIIWDRGTDVVFGVDRLRALPLFYSVVDGELWVGDDADALVARLPEATLCPGSEASFLATKLYVTGSGTLLRELFQVEGAAFCRFDAASQSLESRPYYHLTHSAPERDPDVLKAQMLQVYQHIGKRMVLALDGRTAVIPLSGGADSRMILSLLKQENYPKVLCFTYGKEGDGEVQISRQVARNFGYPWVLVPYTKQMWAALGREPETAAFERRAFAYTSTPHMQDYLAVKYLKEQGVLPEDSVFIPGHTIISGYLQPKFLEKTLPRETFLRVFTEKFYETPVSPVVRKQIEDRFPPCDPGDTEGMAAQFEWFNINERQSKFIGNSGRTYEHFGYEWLLPLWDNELFAFWERIPMEYRFQRRLYLMLLNRDVPSTEDPSAVKTLAERIRRIPGVRDFFRRGMRVLRYWNSQFCIEHLFPAGLYLKSCFCESPLFDVNTLLCYQRLEQLKRELSARAAAERNGRPKSEKS